MSCLAKVCCNDLSRASSSLLGMAIFASFEEEIPPSSTSCPSSLLSVVHPLAASGWATVMCSAGVLGVWSPAPVRVTNVCD